MARENDTFESLSKVYWSYTATKSSDRGTEEAEGRTEE